MNDVAARMTERGIFTSLALVWIHLHPLDQKGRHGPIARVYWYFVAAMQRWIRLTNPPVATGHSKDPDRTPTGAGHKIPKALFFIKGATVDPGYCLGLDWSAMTDREAGIAYGEMVITALLEDGVIPLHRIVTLARSQREQYAGIDGTISWKHDVSFEAKTEVYPYSNNLFVQTHERGHLPNYGPGGIKRETCLPPFEGGAA